MKTLEELFRRKICELFSAEKHVIALLPKVSKHTTNKELKCEYELCLTETTNQKNRLQKICKELELNTTDNPCAAMEVLVAETENFIDLKTVSPVMDAGILAQFQSILHYEIANYASVVSFSKKLKLDNILGLLRQSLDEKYGQDDRLCEIDNNIN